MPNYKPVPTAPFIKGLNASTDVYTQPKGTFPRGSNLLLNSRGALDTCDGTQLIHAFQDQVQTGRGKVLCDFLFSPTGVSSYYLALMQALDLPLGPPLNLTIANGGAGGTLAAGTYFYKVTATDGVGGETLASNEVSITIGANNKITLTWNVVPNAASYNIYRGGVSGAETLISGGGAPVGQVGLGNLTVSFTDDGTATGTLLYNVTSAVITSVSGAGLKTQYNALFFVPSTTGLFAGMIFIYVPGSKNSFALLWSISAILSPTQFIAGHFGPAVGGLFPFAFTNGGTFNAGVVAPLTDTTQQIALYKMPVIAGSPAVLPVAYDHSNIVALFPANLTSFATVGGGGGGSGGGGGTGGGGTGGGGGGRPIFTP